MCCGRGQHQPYRCARQLQQELWTRLTVNSICFGCTGEARCSGLGGTLSLLRCRHTQARCSQCLAAPGLRGNLLCLLLYVADVLRSEQVGPKKGLERLRPLSRRLGGQPVLPVAMPLHCAARRTWHFLPESSMTLKPRGHGSRYEAACNPKHTASGQYWVYPHCAQDCAGS